MDDRFKFRCYDKDQKYIDYCKGTYLEEFLKNPDIFIPMQCTGLKDKNDKLIYEGDIIKGRLTDEISVVVWEKAEFLLKTKPYSYMNWDTSEQAVIGNIYENPELINGE